jgi:hypothetical protein
MKIVKHLHDLGSYPKNHVQVQKYSQKQTWFLVFSNAEILL